MSYHNERPTFELRKHQIGRSVKILEQAVEADLLDAKDCQFLHTLPMNLHVRRMDFSGCTALQSLPPGMVCDEICLKDTRMRALPADLYAASRIDLEDNVDLVELPKNLTTGVLILRGCTGLKCLPEGLDVRFLDIVGCTGLKGWPEKGVLRHGRLNMRGCVNLTSVPAWLEEVSQLDVSGCSQLKELPEHLVVHHWVDVAGTQLRAMPIKLQDVRLRWRGIFVDERIAFRPESITAEEILTEKNAERRRVLLERFGFSRFMKEARAEQLDMDRDPGGERRLLRLQLQGDEDLVCVSFICPSTGRQYITRVPPQMTTCHQAVAWMAGFDNPKDYKLIKET